MKENGIFGKFLLTACIAVLAAIATVWGNSQLLRVTEIVSLPVQFAFFMCLYLVISWLIMQINLLKRQDMAYGSINPLTGIYHKRAFVELAELEIIRASRKKSEFSIVSLSLQMPASIKEKISTREQVRLKKSIIAIVRASSRKTDILADLDGDVFALFMPDTDEQQMKMVVERMYKRFQSQIGRARYITLSIGGVTASGGHNAMELIRCADEQMFLANQDESHICLIRMAPDEKGVS